MPRRRYSVSKPPKAPKTIKIVKPALDVNGLKYAYEWMPVNKDAGFKLAFDWYQTNLTTLLFGAPLNDEQQKSYGRALKSKAQGDHTTFDGERYTAWNTALRFYEKTWAALSLPKVDDALAAAEMGTETTRRVTDVQTVLNMLNSAYEGVATFRMTFGNERKADGTEVLLPVTELTAMVPMTPLKSAMREIPTVAKLLSIVRDAETGDQSLDGGKFMETLPVLLDKISNWASYGNLATKAIGKAGKAAPTAQRASTAKAVRTPRGPRNKANAGQVIHLVPNAIAPSFRDIKAKIADLLRNGQTFAEYQASVAANIAGKNTWNAKTVLEAYVAAGAANLT